MNLNELLSSTYPWTYKKKSDDYLDIQFDADPGTVSVNFWFNELMQEELLAASVSFNRGGHHSLTGKGDAFKVMATVIAIIKEVVAKYKFDVLYFSADPGEKSRVSLYDKLSKKLLMPGYEIVNSISEVKDYYREAAESWYNDAVDEGYKSTIFVRKGIAK